MGAEPFEARYHGKGQGAYHVECFGSTTDQARSDHLKVVSERTRTQNEIAKWGRVAGQRINFPQGVVARRVKPKKKPPLAR